MAALNETLKITEIYVSIQGEAAYAGWPCVMVRLTGCPLRCRWCDTVYSFEGGQGMSLSELSEKISGFQVPLVEFTGGEPLAQEPVKTLMQDLLNKGHKVMVETGGSESLEGVPREVHVIMDLKCPDSGMSHKNRYENLDLLKQTDEIKFVIASQKDFDWALKTLETYDLVNRFEILFSPAWGLVSPKDLVDWILKSKKRIRLNLQQHKYIWSPRAKGV